MAQQTWGMLEKSMFDPEKIEEAIARLIAEHNDDETAHLGAGQSLQSHKASEIIDHLAGSIIADKFSATDKTLITTFNSYDQFDKNESGGIVEIIGPELNLISGFNANNWCDVRAASDVAISLDFEKDPFCQITAWISSFADAEMSFGFGKPEVDEEKGAFGFRVYDGKLYGFIFDDPDFTEVEITGITAAAMNVYRAVVNSTEKKVYFYVNGAEKGSVEFEDYPVASYYTYYFYLKGLTTSSKRLAVRNVMLSVV